MTYLGQNENLSCKSSFLNLECRLRPFNLENIRFTMLGFVITFTDSGKFGGSEDSCPFLYIYKI